MMTRALLLVCCVVVGFALQAEEVSDDEATAYRAAWSAAVDRVTPDGYLYDELRRCAGCHDSARDSDGNSTHRNAIGIAGDSSSPVVTGNGWISGAHGRSQDAAIVSNTHCAWCHAPSQPGVTASIADGLPVEEGRVGVSCIACHGSDAADEKFGTYQTNFRPGGDRESLEDFIPRPQSSGIETNNQCLFCHLRAHPFEMELHGELVAAGELTCVHCHMAVYNVTEAGRKERYHNMKVAANEDPRACGPCHGFSPSEMAARCEDLVPEFGSMVHAVPDFE